MAGLTAGQIRAEAQQQVPLGHFSFNSNLSSPRSLRSCVHPIRHRTAKTAVPDSVPDRMTSLKVTVEAGASGGLDVADVLQIRREMRAQYGWKETYGPTVSAPEAQRRRHEAEVAADGFIGRCAHAFGADKDAVERLRTERERLRTTFGWKADYGITTSTSKAVAKRAEAERKAEEALVSTFGG